ncbi:conserved hypothetical protein [Streptomyces sp. SPB074]|nr:conserved hypothetical protein [Streptomyces sp. SPB074]
MLRATSPTRHTPRKRQVADCSGIQRPFTYSSPARQPRTPPPAPRHPVSRPRQHRGLLAARRTDAPTYETLPCFTTDLDRLTSEQRHRFRQTVAAFVEDLRTGRFRTGLRVKLVQRAPGIYELIWSMGTGPAGRAKTNRQTPTGFSQTGATSAEGGRGSKTRCSPPRDPTTNVRIQRPTRLAYPSSVASVPLLCGGRATRASPRDHHSKITHRVAGLRRLVAGCVRAIHARAHQGRRACPR